MRRIMAAAGLCALGAASVLADTSKPTAPIKPVVSKVEPEPIVRLVERLGVRDYKTREAAAKALETRGLEALPELRKALDASTSAEVRRRLSGMVQNLERLQLLAPKRLTITMKERPAADVIREVSRLTGYAMQFQGGNNVPVSVEKHNATFWEVMDHVTAVAGLTMYHNENQGIMLYSNDSQNWPHVIYQGPFKVVANSFNYNKTINLGPVQRNAGNHPTRHETLSFNFTVHAEPKLPLLGMGQPRLLEAVDDLGNSMKPQTAAHETFYGPNYNGYRSYQYNSAVNLVWPNKEARHVKRLRGTLPVTLLAEQKPDVVAEDVLKAKGRKLTGNNVEMVIEDVTEQNNKTQFHFKLSVRNTAGTAGHDYSWTNSVHQRVELQDAKGNKYFPQGYNWINSSPGHIQATFMYGNNGNAALGPPAKLVYNHWVLLQHAVEFDFKDLQLP